MTFLQIINRILRKLREKQVTTLTSEYTNFIGQLVNDAKEDIEAAWDWKCLRTNITVTTVAGTQDYTLTGTNERSRLLYDKATGWPMAFNLTEDGAQLYEVGLETIRRDIAEVSDNQKPYRFAIVRSNSGLTMRIYPKPDAVYSLQVTCVVPQAELTSASTTLTIPWQPVYRQALAEATAERGTGLGGNLDTLFNRATRSLHDAIMQDVEPDELMLRAD